jgi:hypothetical protein
MVRERALKIVWWWDCCRVPINSRRPALQSACRESRWQREARKLDVAVANSDGCGVRPSSLCRRSLERPALDAWMNSEELHRSQAADGSVLICLNSLLARVQNTKSR